MREADFETLRRCLREMEANGVSTDRLRGLIKRLDVPADVEAVARHWVEHGRTDSFGNPDPGDWDHIKAHKPIAYSEAVRVATWALSLRGVQAPAPQLNVAGDNQPRYTTKRLHDEIAKAKEYARYEALAEVREALTPFAVEADAWPNEQAPDDYRLKVSLATKTVITKLTVGDLRRARAVLGGVLPAPKLDVKPNHRTHCDFPKCDCSSGAFERCSHPPASVVRGPHLRAVGIGRDPENDQVVFLSLNRRPTDDEVRAIHGAIGRTPATCPFCTKPTYVLPCSHCGEPDVPDHEF